MNKLEQILAGVKQHPERAASAVADYFTGYKFFKYFKDYVKEFIRDRAASTTRWGSLSSSILTASELLYVVAYHQDTKRAMLAVAAFEAIRPVFRVFFHYDAARWLVGAEKNTPDKN